MEAPEFTLVKPLFQIAGVVRTVLDEQDDESAWPVFDESSESVEPERLFVDGVELFVTESQSIRNHSQGFSWGYAGSGPAQTALAICLHIFQNRYVAEALYQDFKFAFVEHWQPVGKPFNVVIDVTDFLIDHRERLQQALQWEQWDREDRAIAGQMQEEEKD